MYYKASHTRGGLLVSALLLCIWTLFPTQVLGDTLTYRFAPHERSCFFVLAKAKGEKLAVYYSVQSAGSSDNYNIDLTVKDSKGQEIVQTRDSTGDYLFSAVSPGEYSLCFLNTEGAEKSVYFDATAETDTEGKGPGTELRTMPGSAGAQKAELRQTVVPMEATIQKLYDSLASVQRQQRYFHTRENRNLSTVQSTGSRIIWFSIFECLLAVAIALAQVFIIQTFFARSGGKGRI